MPTAASPPTTREGRIASGANRDKSVTFEDPDGWRVVIGAVTGV